MKLTHDQIATMTPHEVNVAIAERRGATANRIAHDCPDYFGEWQLAGILLDELVQTSVFIATHIADIPMELVNQFLKIGLDLREFDTKIPLTDSIARQWLINWEATHE